MSQTSSEPALQFEDVSLFFDENPALRSVSFTVPPGETRIIHGAAGSGKSVLLKCAIRLLRPNNGTIRLLGKVVTEMEEDELFEVRERVGMLFQESGLFDSMTIEENVAYPILNQRGSRKASLDKERTTARVRDALRFVELEHTLVKFPSELSGGMRRRAGIARAAVTNPPIMLYDSPTAGLDPITANTIMALVAKARDTRNTTSVIVTHRHQDGYIMANFRYNPDSGQLEPAPRDSDVQQKTRFMVFREGSLVFEGTQEELRVTKDPYVRLFQGMRAKG